MTTQDKIFFFGLLAENDKDPNDISLYSSFDFVTVQLALSVKTVSINLVLLPPLLLEAIMAAVARDLYLPFLS